MINEMLHYEFNYIDEFGQKTTMTKELDFETTLEVSNSYYSLVDVFVQFLKACGYSNKVISERINMM